MQTVSNSTGRDYMGASRYTAQGSAAAREQLSNIIETGLDRSAGALERIINATPVDYLHHGADLQFHAEIDIEHDIDDKASVLLGPKGTSLRMHENAIGQAADRMKIPSAFARRLATSPNSWERTLWGDLMTEHYQHINARSLIRSVDGEVRGFLSDRYRRLDSAPLLDAVIGEAGKVGMVPYEAHTSDLRSRVRFIHPTVYEPIPGESMVFGLDWKNSDFGAGGYGITVFMMRLVCLNGMTSDNAINKIHLGAQLPDDVQLSEKTYRLDTERMVSLTHDTVRGLLSPKAIDAKCDRIAKAHSESLELEVEGKPTTAWATIKRQLSKADAGTIADSFNSEDGVMMPANRTRWRLSNAISLLANAKKGDRKHELQGVAAKVAGV